MAKPVDAGPAPVRKRGARRTPVRKWMHDALRGPGVGGGGSRQELVRETPGTSNDSASSTETRAARAVAEAQIDRPSRQGARRRRTEGNRTLAISIVLAALVWVGESALDAFVFSAGSFAGRLFTPTSYELWMRILTTAVIVGFGAYSHRAVGMRQQTRAALHESEELYRLLAENASDVIAAADINGRPTYMSPSYEVLTGFTPEEAMGRTMEESLTPDSLKAAAESLSAAMPGDASGGRHDPGKSVIDLEFYRKDGSTVWVEARINLISGSNGQPTGLVSVLRDITERRTVEDALRHSEDHFRALVENSSDAIVVLNGDGTIRYESPSMDRMLGYEAGERVGQVGFDFVHPDDMAAATGAFTELMANPGSMVQLEVRGLDKDGSWRNLEVVGSNLAGNPAVAGIVINMRDVTERKQAEKTLRQSELEYELLVGSLADAAFRYRDGAIIWGNDRIQEMLGYSKDEVIGEDVNLFVPDDVDLEALMKKVVVSLKEEGHFRGETTARKKDGSWVDIEYTASQVPGRDTFELVGVARDITERKRAWEIVRASEEKYRELINTTADGVISVDAGMNVVLWNQGAERIFGYSEEEILGQSLYKIIPQRYRKAKRKAVRLYAGTGTGPLLGNVTEIEGLRKDGTEVPVELSMSSRKVGDTYVATSIVRDITERKRADELVRESEERYRNVVSTTLDSILILDATTRQVVEVNEAACKLYGCSREELLSLKLDDLTAEPDNTDKRFVGTLKGEIAKVPFGYSRKRDGTIFPVDISVSTFEMGGRRVLCSIIRDITERKTAEEERERLAAELAEKNRELEHIVYVSSHDMRSPLVNVQGFSKELNYSLMELVSILEHEEIPQDVREKLTPIIETDIADSLTYIQASVLKMDSLLSGLLRLSRLGRAALNVETINLDEMMSEVVKANEYRIKSARVTVEIGDLPPCVGDSMQINQVFSNLVDNALKYLDPARPGAIRVTGSVNGASSVYCVADNGVGIAEKDLEQVFEIFKQINPGASTGDGIGLAVVKKIIGRSSGRIWVESEPGVGSKFFVSLPAADDHEPEGEEQ